MASPDPIAALRQILARVRLGLEEQDGAWMISYESERHPLLRLPLEGLDEETHKAELIAAAAGLEAAAKYPGGLEDTDFMHGAANLLPKVERARFVDAFHSLLEGRGAPDSERLCHRDLGCGLVVVYVRDEGWRFHHVTEGQRARWGVSPGTIDAGARSNLYHRATLDHHATTLSLGDGYDGARVLVTSDVFYHLGSRDEGIPVAPASRDALLVGAAATGAAARETYEGATYPLHPRPLRFRDGRLHEAG